MWQITTSSTTTTLTTKKRFNNETKNYKVYYDGAFYVGEKRFDNINDLVHDGLISFYIEKHASNYIAMMAEESNYAESPYVASRTALLAARNKPASSSTAASNQQNLVSNHSAPDLHPMAVAAGHHRVSPPTQSIHSSFQRQHQQPSSQQQPAVSSHHSFSASSHVYPNNQMQHFPNQHLHHIHQVEF